MSVTSSPQSPREKSYGIQIQTAWGTAIADGAAFIELDCEPTEIMHDVKNLIIEGAHGSRQRNDTDIIVHNRNTMPTLALEAFLKKEELSLLLAAFYQNVVEAGSTPWGMTFDFLTGQPDFIADAGYVFTIVERDPIAANSKKMADAILKAITITQDREEPLKASMEWIARGQVASSTPSGTWTRQAPDNLFFCSDLDRQTIDFGSGNVSFNVNGFEFALSHDVIGQGQDGAGGFNTYALANPTGEFSITVMKDTDYEDAITNWKAGTPIDFNLAWGNASPGTDDGDLDFTGHGKITSCEKNHDDPMEGVIAGTLSTDGTDESLTTIIADGVQDAWD